MARTIPVPSGSADEVAPEPGFSAKLKRHAPLVPVHSAENRALVAVIAILAFLAALCACIAELVATASGQWQGSVGREMTIQVRPTPQRDIETDVARAAELARGKPGIAGVQLVSKADAESLLEPWLGAGLDLSDLPVPRLIVVKLDPAVPVDVPDLRLTLAREVPSASLDDHAVWLSRLATMARAVVAVAVAAVLLVFLAAGLAVAFATRGAVAANREVVDVLHFVGADNAFIAREFQRRFFRIGLKGGAVGGVCALLFLTLCGFLASRWSATATGGQIEALFGNFDLGWQGYGSVVLVAAVASVMTAIVSQVTVRRFLREPEPRSSR
jgi:cell division transport system permease protein